MTLSPHEISDRLEIQDTITRYSHGLDQRLWEEWDRAFTPDAVLDFSAVGLTTYTPAEARTLFTQNDSTRIAGQHLLLNTLIDLDGDRATARSEFLLFTLARTDEEGRARRNNGGGWYDDELARTAAGWRIVRRSAGLKWFSQDVIDWPPPAS